MYADLSGLFFVCVLGARRTEVAEVTAEGESGS